LQNSVVKEYTLQGNDNRAVHKKMNQSMDEPEDFNDKTPGPNHIRNEDDDYDSGPGTHDYRNEHEELLTPSGNNVNQVVDHN